MSAPAVRTGRLAELLPEAWRLRRENFGNDVSFSAPSSKRYDSPYHQNSSHSFPTASVTGAACALRCDHCRGKILRSMRETRTPAELLHLGEEILAAGGDGLLLSGGANGRGEVPVAELAPAIRELSDRGLKILVHTGLVTRETARLLRESGVRQVLLDILGDAETIRRVYHLDRSPSDYLESLRILREEGLSTAPHIVVGLHYGELRGEYEALRLTEEAGADMLVIVVLNPLPGTPMADVRAPSAQAVAELLATARVHRPRLPISLGCARPPGPEKVLLEKLSLLAGANAVAYPMPETVAYARRIGLRESFHDRCCTL